MTYVGYIENQFCITGREYLFLRGDELYGYHEPQQAQFFDTAEEAKDILSAALDDQELIIEDLRDVIKHFKEHHLKPYRVRKSMAMSRPYKGERREELVQFWVDHLKNQTPITQEHFRQWPDLYMDYQNLHRVILTLDSKIGFEIKTPKDGDLEQFKEEMKTAIKYNEHMEDGLHRFEIFDYRLNEHGEHAWLLTDGVMGEIHERYGEGSGWKTLEECFTHMRYCNYYE